MNVQICPLLGQIYTRFIICLHYVGTPWLNWKGKALPMIQVPWKAFLSWKSTRKANFHKFNAINDWFYPLLPFGPLKTTIRPVFWIFLKSIYWTFYSVLPKDWKECRLSLGEACLHLVLTLLSQFLRTQLSIC